MKNVTIKEIAKQLGVSKSTVSRALRDSYEIGSETKSKILALAKELDYVPNYMAVNLMKNQATRDLGVIVPDISNPFFSLVIAGIEDVAFAEGFHVNIYQSHDEYEREVRNVDYIYRRRKDGLLVSVASNTTNYEHFKMLQDKEIPIVFFDRICEEIDTHKVSVDDFEGAYKATCHLIEQGCKHIINVSGPQNLLINKRRFQGYRAALLDNGHKIEENQVYYGDYSSVNAKKIMLNILQQSKSTIDGVFASSDNIAVGCHSAILAHGLKMPDDIALIGFSDLPIVSMLTPPLSSIAQPAFEMGRSATQLLIDLIKNPKPTQTISNVLKTELIVRASSLKKSDSNRFCGG